MTLLREAAHDVKKAAHLPNLPNLPRMSMGMGRMSFGPSAILASLPPKIDEDDSTEKTRERRSFKEHCVRAGIVGFVLLILCCIPHIMHQYEPDAAIAATSGAHVVAGVETVSVPLTHKYSGLYEIIVGAGKCDAYAPEEGNVYTNSSYYSATVSLTQDGNVLKSDTLKLHDKGAASGGGGGGGRRLLAGGGGGGDRRAPTSTSRSTSTSPPRNPGDTSPWRWIPPVPSPWVCPSRLSRWVPSVQANTGSR